MLFISCSNGHKLKIKPRLAGKTVRCPKCSVSVKIPDLIEPDNDSAKTTKPKPEPAEYERQSWAESTDSLSTEDAGSEWNDDWSSDSSDEAESTESGYDPYGNDTKLPPRKRRRGASPASAAPVTEVASDKSPGKWGALHWAGVAGGGFAALILGVVVIWLATSGSDAPVIAVNKNTSPSGMSPSGTSPSGTSTSGTSTSGTSTSVAASGVPPSGMQHSAGPTDGIGSLAAAEARLKEQQRIAAQTPADFEKIMPPPAAIPSGNNTDATSIARQDKGPAMDAENHSSASAAQPAIAASRGASKSKPKKLVIRPRGGRSLISSSPHQNQIEVGKNVLLQVAEDVTDIQFAVEPLADDAVAEPTPNWIQPFVAPPPDPNAPRLGLEASIFGAQEFILVSSVQEVQSIPVPFKIRIGREIMTVTQVDSFKDALRVERPNATSHSVTEGLYLMSDDDVASQAPPEGIPLLEQGQIHWTPTAKDVGRRLVFVRGSSTNPRMAKEWVWDVVVTDPSQEEPAEEVAEEEFAMIESFDPIKPLIEEPVAELTADQKRVLKTESQSIEKQLVSIRREDRGVAARFESNEDGTVNVRLRPLRVEEDDGVLPAQTLSFGNGILLPESKLRWEKTDKLAASQELLTNAKPVEYPEKEAMVRVHQLNRIAEQSDASHRFRRTLSSADGKWLYLLTKDGHLLKVDVAKWEVTKGIQRSDGFHDMCWSSQGLVLLKSPSPIPRQAGGDGWFDLEAIPGNRQPQLGNHLLVLDPDSLEITKALGMGGSAIAGHLHNDRVYVEQASEQRIMVVNVAEGTLSNVVLHQTLDGTAASPSHMAFGAMFDDLMLIGNGHSLILRSRTSRQNGMNTVHRMALSGGRILPVESSSEIPVDEPFACSADGQIVSFTGKTVQQGLQFLPTANLAGSGHSIYVRFPAMHHTTDPDSKTIAFTQPVTTSGLQIEGDYGKVELNVLRGSKRVIVPVGLETVIDMLALPGGRGILMTTDKSTMWLEMLSKGEQWTFERQTPAILPIAKCDIPSTIPKDPNEWSQEKLEKELKSGNGSAHVAWNPERTAFFTKGGESIYRFDAATRIETHRWTPEEIESTYGRIVPEFFVTQDGIVFDHRQKRTLYLLSFDDLTPIWKIPSAYVYRPTGSPLHNRVTALCDPGVVVFEAASGRVIARASHLDLWREWPERINDRVKSVSATADPDIIECVRNQKVRLRITDGRLRLDKDK